MANDLNRCEFIGRLGKDPEIRFMQNGDAVANFSIAVGSTWRDKQSGEKREATEWIPIVCFGKLAEVCRDYLKKGSRVFIAGKFKTRKWQDQSGQDRYSTEVVVDMQGTMQMLDSKADGQSRDQGTANYQPQQSSGGGQNTVDFDDDIPF